MPEARLLPPEKAPLTNTETDTGSDAQAQAFITRWQGVAASELSTAQSFVRELCELLGVPVPHATPDQSYLFERPVTFRHGDGSSSPGRIDCYKRGHFVLESKKLKAGTPTKGFDDALLRARAQAENYARALPAEEGRPPFLLVVDVGNVIELYSEFSRSGATYTPFPDPRSHRIALASLIEPALRERLKNIWLAPDSLNPARASARVTRQVATQLAELAKSLEASGHRADHVAAFLTRSLFSMFAEDVELLPKGSFLQLLETHREQPVALAQMLRVLWQNMDEGGFSPALAIQVLKFNGKLFKNSGATGYALVLDDGQIAQLIRAAKSNWREVEPAIFGTLLERALDPAERHALGAHYTPRAYVERLVLPTVIEPLRADWVNAQAAALVLAREAGELAGPAAAQKLGEARAEISKFHHQLCSIRVLDPACGSGNFLYVTLEHLKRLEGEVINQLEDLGQAQSLLGLEGETVTPQQLLGIEINDRAAALAELVLWIGYLQWHLRTRGNKAVAEPVIHDYGNIECRDAVLAWDEADLAYDDGPGGSGRLLSRWDGKTFTTHLTTGAQVPDENALVPQWKYLGARKAAWPAAEYIVGNPPFIGASTMRAALGDGYVAALRKTWPEVPESADFVMHWWQNACDMLRSGLTRRFGFITTNSIRQTFNRRVLERNLLAGVVIDFAIPDHPWVDSAQGAAVRIAMTVGRRGTDVGQMNCNDAIDGSKRALLLRVTREMPGEHGESKVELTPRKGCINADLTIGANISNAHALQSNENLSNRGVQLFGAGFIVTPDEAARLLPRPLHASPDPHAALPKASLDALPDSPSGAHELRRSRQSTAPELLPLPQRAVPDFLPLPPGEGGGEGQHKNQPPPAVIRDYRNGRDLTDRPRGVQVIDLFGLSARQVREQFPAIYQWLLDRVKPERDQNNRASYRDNWWIHGEPRKKMRKQLATLPRYIATVETAKHRSFQFLDAAILPDNMLIAIASDDAFLLGVLSSQVHEVWALAVGGRLGVGNDPRYNKSRCFETFPFPDDDTGLTPALRLRIATLAEQIDAHRKRQQAAHASLTLTGIYNVLDLLRQPADSRAWTAKEKSIHEQGLVGVLRELHDELDAAVLQAYGWADLTTGPGEPQASDSAEVLSRLVALNARRAGEEKTGLIRWLRPAFQHPATAAAPGQAAQSLSNQELLAPVVSGLQADLALISTPPAAPPAASAAGSTVPPWPATLPAQVSAVALLLAAAQQALPLPAIEAAFRGKGQWKKSLPRILETLEALGRARREGASQDWRGT